MKNGFQFLLSGCSALALLACGDDVTKMTNVTNETTGMEVAASADSLGACDSAAIGKTVFASSESSVYICADSGWVPLSKTAASGKDGADGENGSDGASCTVAALSDSSGYKVVCGGDSVGVILNGADGKDGASGENGSDGKDGANGTSCTVAALSDGSGYKIVCGGDSVGVVLNGTDGAAGNSCSAKALADGSGYKIVCGGDSVGVILNGTNGKDGADGKDGTSGNSCSAKALADGSGYKIVCGGDSVGVILNGTNGKDGKDGASGENGCRLASDSSGVVKIVCAASDTVTLYKAICGVEAYDPAEKFCFADSLVRDLCGAKNYDPTRQFCFDGESYNLCGGKSYDPRKEICKSSKIFGKLLDTRDGAEYRTIRLGKQTWMAENLNYKYSSGSAKSYCYNNSAQYCETYGRLYSWAAAMDSSGKFSDGGKGCGYDVTCSAGEKVRGVCPEGWHLPNVGEWSDLETFVADSLFGEKTDSVGYALKSKSGWSNNSNSSDAVDFGALPAGFGYSNGESFGDLLNGAYFWSSTEGSEINAYYQNLRNDVTVLSPDRGKNYGRYKNAKMSVRCVKDEPSEE